jgi:hypothetical protein
LSRELHHATRTDTPPTGIALTAPPDWFVLDLDPLRRDASVARVVAGRIALDPHLAPHRAKLVAVLSRAARDAAAAGVVLTASYSATDPAGRPFSANLNVMFAELGPVTDLDDLRDRYAEEPTGPAGRQVEVVELPVGPAVRIAETRSEQIDEGFAAITVATEQYIVPVPGDERRAAVLTFTSPTPAEPLAAVFAAVAGTFRFVTGEEGR